MNSAHGYTEGAEVPEDKTPTHNEYICFTWVSVKHRLPPFGQGVLVAIDTGAITIAYRTEDTNPGYRKEYAWQLFGDKYKTFDLDDFNQITHWMTLPEPPKIESLKNKPI